MFTYIPEEKILFSSDAFGQHYAGPEMFDDNLSEIIMHHAKKYYANILMLYSTKTLKLLAAVEEAGLSFDMICPDHGVIWRKNPGAIIEAYKRWSNQETEEKAVLIYDSMWKSTKKMAEAITDGLAEGGVTAIPMALRKFDRSDIMTDVLDAKAIIVGSPTLNNNLFPTIADFLTYMKGLRPKGRIGAAFGSYGWSGESVKIIEKELTAMKMDLPLPGLKVQYVPDEDALKECFEYGKKIAQAIKA
jgi:flavorubredoxin